ncbi:hypothetical protein HPB49_013204 [Dermacentor silvarum]|uniref:Uncharacterized protein n=1 Tax=Dermacentor silvarum TaxID=543639 RepID=A0ACB8CRT0_DERSI|nr:hypothetical protein HPB49_013204 [Dermacentor silvarum]
MYATDCGFPIISSRCPGIKNGQARGNAISVLQREFPFGSGEYKICSSCKDSLVAGKVPPMSVSYGYRYPPKPDHLPPLNPVEERLIAPRLRFMSITWLTYGRRTVRHQGQVVNVPINVPNTVQYLPRNVPDDAAIDVHLKRRLVCKPSYKKGLVKKRNVHEWLKHLEHSPLYKYLNITVDWSRLVDDDGDVDDDNIEPAPEITALEDPMQAVIALSTMSHTMLYDDGATGGATGGDDTAAATVAELVLTEDEDVMPFPPTEDEAEKEHPQKLKRRYGKMHEALERGLSRDHAQGVEMSAHEAAWFLLGQEMSEKSREVVHIPTCYPEERVPVRKTNEELAKIGASSTVVWKLNIVHSKYKRGYGLREHPVIIRYHQDIANDNPDDYIREQVLLYVPFRNEAVDILDNNKYVQTYEANKELIASKHRQYKIANDDDIVVRQSDASFSALLTKIGDGRALEDQEVRLLKSRFITAEEALVRASAVIRMSYSNEEVNKFNTFIAHQGGTNVVSLQADDTIGYVNQDALKKAIAKVQKMSHTEFANLPREILVTMWNEIRYLPSYELLRMFFLRSSSVGGNGTTIVVTLLGMNGAPNLHFVRPRL